jgi:DeoR/GlpR family transcriptional regulator of sugar metabolism
MVSKAAKTRIALADHTKFGRQRFAFVGPVSDIDILITDSGTDARYIDELRDAGVQVVVAEAARAKRNEPAAFREKVASR